MAFEELSGELAPGVLSLSVRIENIGVTLHGTNEDPELGLVYRVRKIEGLAEKITTRLNVWGGILLGAFIVSGFLNGAAAKAIHDVIGAFIKGAG